MSVLLAVLLAVQTVMTPLVEDDFERDRQLAEHEARHAVVGFVLGLPLVKVQIFGCGVEGSNACTEFDSKKFIGEDGHVTVVQHLNWLAAMAAPYNSPIDAHGQQDDYAIRRLIGSTWPNYQWNVIYMVAFSLGKQVCGDAKNAIQAVTSELLQKRSLSGRRVCEIVLAETAGWQNAPCAEYPED